MLRSLGFVSATVLVVGLLGLLAFGLSSRPLLAGAATEGRPAKEFVLPGFDGSTVSLADYRGRVVLVNFWASWCVPCRIEAPVLEQTWRRYRDRGLVLVGINLWDKEPEARAFLREFGITYPNARDEGGRVAIEYGVAGIPETIVIAPDGLVSGKHSGALSSARIVELARGAGLDLQ